MKRSDQGFTLIEVVLVLFIGGILISIAVSSTRNALAGYSASAARNTFVALHARARVRAVERGENAILFMDPANDSASVIQGGTVVETIHFMSEYNVDFQGPGVLELCMSSRGFAESSCTSFSSVQTVRFRFNADTVGVRILPLGQLLY